MNIVEGEFYVIAIDSKLQSATYKGLSIRSGTPRLLFRIETGYTIALPIERVKETTVLVFEDEK